MRFDAVSTFAVSPDNVSTQSKSLGFDFTVALLQRRCYRPEKSAFIVRKLPHCVPSVIVTICRYKILKYSNVNTKYWQ